MKIFKCLSQNVSMAQDTQEIPERRKYFLGFRQKKRRSVGVSRTNGFTSKGAAFPSPVKENELPLAGAIVKRKLSPENDTVKRVSVSSGVTTENVSGAGESPAASKKQSLSTYRSRPSLQSTPYIGKSRAVDDREDVRIDETINSNTSATTAFFRKMNVSMGDYLPSFAIYQSPKDCRDESVAIDSPDVRHLNTALIAGSSATDSCMAGYSNSINSAQFSSCNSAVEWSSYNTTYGSTFMTNSTTTSNKGCSTDSSLDSTSSFISRRSVPTFPTHNTKQKQLEFTTQSDTYLATTAHRREYYRNAEVDTRASSEKDDMMEIACDSSRICDIGLAAVNAAKICHDSVRQTSKGYDRVSQAGMFCDSVSHSGIDYDDSVSRAGIDFATLRRARKCHDSVSQAGRGYDLVSQAGRDYDSVSQASRFSDSVSQAGRFCDSVSHSDIDYDDSVSQTGIGYKSISQTCLNYTSISQAGKAYNSLSQSGIDYDDSVSQAGKSYDSLTRARGCDSVPQTMGCDSVSSAGIDYDYSTADSRLFRQEQQSQQMDTDASQFSSNITSECPPSALEMKFMYIEQLMSLEQDFLTCMHFGIRKYWKPLQYCILTRYEHTTLFTNIEMLVKISKANLKSMRDNAAPDDSQTSEDQHMMLYLPATVYELEIQKQCKAYQLYGKELDRSNKLLKELNLNNSFRDFVKSQHATQEHYRSHLSERCPSIQEFINRPAMHIQQLYTALQNILSVTPRDSHDAPLLVRVTEAIFKCIQKMKLRY